jgi:peroxiredoxin
VVVAINTAEESDPMTRARAFQQRHGLTYPILVDTEGAVRKAYAISGFPTNLIIDRDGTVRYVGAGFDATGIDRALRELMDGQRSPG